MERFTKNLISWKRWKNRTFQGKSLQRRYKKKMMKQMWEIRRKWKGQNMDFKGAIEISVSNNTITICGKVVLIIMNEKKSRAKLLCTLHKSETETYKFVNLCPSVPGIYHFSMKLLEFDSYTLASDNPKRLMQVK